MKRELYCLLYTLEIEDKRMGSPSESFGKQSNGRLKSPALFPFLSSCGFLETVLSFMT